MRRRGLSLLETLLTLFLLALILAVTADLMMRARRISSFYQQKSDLQQGAFALERLCLQVMGAGKIVNPPLNGSTDRLEWVRVNPDVSGRLPTTLGAVPAPVPPPSPVWDPTAAAWTELISVYRQDNGDLMWYGASGEVLLCSNLSSFQCRSTNRMLELRAEVIVRGQIQGVLVKRLVDAGVSW